MKTTLILTILLCADLFLMIWDAVALYPLQHVTGFMPKDVEEKLKGHRSPSREAFIAGRIILVLTVLAYAAIAVYAAADGIRNRFSFLQFLVRFLVMFYGLKLFDIVCLDWFMLTKTRFCQHYWPETEGCEGYRQFGFNRKQQLRRILFYPLLCFLAARICTLF